MIRGLLLCGGRSTRFGSDKLPLLAPQSAHNLIAGTGNALAVIAPGAMELRRLLKDAGCAILETEATRGGMGASLAAGVAASADAAGWIVALGDMPYIRPATIAAVRARLEAGAPIAAPKLAATGQRGHPVGFSRRHKDELAALASDEGARSVVLRHSDEIVLIEVDDPGIVIDIDRPEDLTPTRS